MKIMSKTPGLFIKSVNPRFVYKFENESLEIPEEHAEKILKNKNFYKVDKHTIRSEKSPQNKPNPSKTWVSELESIKGIGQKTALDIFQRYPHKKLLIKDLKENKRLPFRDDVEALLKKSIR